MNIDDIWVDNDHKRRMRRHRIELGVLVALALIIAVALSYKLWQHFIG